MLADAGRGSARLRAFPQAHWRTIWQQLLIERVNGAIKRNVVDIFVRRPNDAAIVRLATAVCVGPTPEWAAAERRYVSEEPMTRSTHPTAESAEKVG